MDKRFWWVNQNQTFKQELEGKYMWSPKRNVGDVYNRFYDNMREVAPGDIVFSFKDGLIQAIGFARSIAYECPKPTEFGLTGRNWSLIGWKIDVQYQLMDKPIKPKNHMNLIAPLLPEKYAPLQQNGNGLQGVYLAAIPEPLGNVLMQLLGSEVQAAIRESSIGTSDEILKNKKADVLEWEDHIERKVIPESDIPETEKERLVMARYGQGSFRSNVQQMEQYCRITKVDNKIHLIASHIKPWRDSENRERLDGENGLFLTPSIDHLFDKGIITFENSGELLVSPRADRISLKRMGVPVDERFQAGGFTEGQKHYLDYHRKEIFLKVS